MRIIPLRAGLDPLALLLALVSPLQSLAEFLGAVAFHRPPDQDAQARCPRRPLAASLGTGCDAHAPVIEPRHVPLTTNGAG